MNFSSGVAEIQQKYGKEREKVRERKFWISVITLPKLLLPKPADQLGVKCAWSVKCPKETNCDNVIAEIGGKKFVAMPLPKMGEKKIVVAEIYGGI